ncbi:MAG TPA: GNAT family N-acetyltransferase [Roseiflexaceae bacterium]|nr:GNAT family N-acetyltransferase [Roseiflexaceae bacterium]
MPVREAQLSDAEGIAEVHVASWRAVYSGLLSDQLLQSLSVERRTQGWRAILAQGDSLVFVYEAEGRIAGFASCGRSRDEQAGSGQTGELFSIYLAPDLWGKGCGTALLHTALDALRAQGYAVVTLWVLDTNRRAILFYERAGFQSDGTSKIETGPGDTPLHEIRYRRTL